MELVRITVRVPPTIRQELKALKKGLPGPLKKASQDEIVGALIRATSPQALADPLTEYLDELEEPPAE
jgi:hypothetical protein